MNFNNLQRNLIYYLIIVRIFGDCVYFGGVYHWAYGYILYRMSFLIKPILAITCACRDAGCYYIYVCIVSTSCYRLGYIRYIFDHGFGLNKKK